MTKIIINEELKNLLPALTDSEYAGLEASILQYGCLTPIVIWKSMIVDGHYRYEICAKHELPFACREMNFDDLEEAKLWAWRHQENRRNLTLYHRAELTLKFKDAIAKEAKSRQQMANHTTGPLPGAPVKTAVELAKLAGVSHDTLHKAEYISSFADEETKDRLRRGEKGTSINREYNRLKLTRTDEPLRVTPATTPGPKIALDGESGTMFVRKDATPEELAMFLVDHFPAEFVRDIMNGLLKMYEQRYGTEATQQILLKNCEKYID